MIDKANFKKEFTKKLMNMFAEEVETSSKLHQFLALGSLAQDCASEKWLKTNKAYAKNTEKEVYYFSMEFLIGRLLVSNLLNLGIYDTCEAGLKELGISLQELEEVENDAGLGNGGLGRLAACFMDSIASLEIPGHGVGIRYRYGLFEQKIVNGYQVEVPDYWLRDRNIWECRKEDEVVKVRFGGNVFPSVEAGRLTFKYENYEEINAVPYDTPVVGYNNNTVNTLRLWSAETNENEFNFSSFSKGDYSKALEYKNSVEAISQVLYPDDSNMDGKKLRLKQQYFFVSAGIQNIIRKCKKNGVPMNKIHEHVAIHINDTHPSVAVAELMRVLVDEELMSWEDAWYVTTRTCAYTNHTIMAEALEKWPVGMFKELLPRVYMIVEEINRRFCEEVLNKYNGDHNKVRDMSIIEGGNIKMAYLAIVGSHSVNGVAKLHTEILKNHELSDFCNMYPDRFNNKTNGITHRRWLIKSNPELTKIITDAIGDGWVKDTLEFEKLTKFKTKKAFKQKIQVAKKNNKIRLANLIKERYGIEVDPNSIFDIQVKRLHAYKRQLLNVFHIMHLYNELKENPNKDMVPRTFIFGAKASPGYYLAKQTIKLINTVAERINNDASINGKIKVVFLENYNVSLAEIIMPAADVSEQISTASKEASGTGNMKFMMNGAVTLATLDGANVEIREAVGDENIVLFGLKAEEVINYYNNGGYSAREVYNNDPRLKKVVDQLVDGSLGVSTSEFKHIYDSLIYQNDEFFVLKDFDAYVRAQEKVDSLYRQTDKWTEMCIENIAHSGIFSSDKTIDQYSEEIWNTRHVTIK